MNQEPVRWLDRLAGACFTVLLAAMALYAAVELVAAVWRPLTIGLAVVAVTGVVGPGLSWLAGLRAC